MRTSIWSYESHEAKSRQAGNMHLKKKVNYCVYTRGRCDCQCTPCLLLNFVIYYSKHLELRVGCVTQACAAYQSLFLPLYCVVIRLWENCSHSKAFRDNVQSIWLAWTLSPKSSNIYKEIRLQTKLEYQKPFFLQWVFSFLIVVASLCFTRQIHNTTHTLQRRDCQEVASARTVCVCVGVHACVWNGKQPSC